MKNKKFILYFTLSAIIFLNLCNPIALALTSPDYTKQINAGSYWALYTDLSYGDTWSIEFEVTAGGNKDITVYVLDEEDYNNFAADESFSYYKYYEKYHSGSFDFTAPSSDTYYVIFDNSFSTFTAKTVEVNTEISYYADTGDTNGDTNGGINIIFNVAGFILFGLSLVIIIVIVILLIKKRKPKQPQQIEIPIQKREEIKLRFCSECGQKIEDPDAKHCKYCGSALI